MTNNFDSIVENILTTVDSQPRLRKDKDLFIKNYSRAKLYELFNQLAISGFGFEPQVANDVSNHLVNTLIPQQDPQINATGAYEEPQVEEPCPQEEPIYISTADAKLTDTPKTLPELSKFIEVLIKHYCDMSQSLQDLLYGACANLQQQAPYDAAAECYECRLAADDAKILVGGQLKQEILEQMSSYQKPLPQKNTREAAKYVFEWMKEQTKSVKKPLLEGSTDREILYWKIKHEAIKEFETKFGEKAIELAWKSLLKTKALDNK